MTIPITEKLIQRQLNHWNGLRQFLVPDKTEAPPPQPPVITISRAVGSGGRHLAEALCERLDLKLHDRSLVENVMRQENLPPALIDEMDEQAASQSSLWIKGLFNQRIFLLKEYQQALSSTINTLADSVGGVFLGRGANHVLGDRSDLRIRVVAGFDKRLKRVQQRVALSRAEARAFLHETDRAREEFIRKVYGAEPGRATNFDLTINTDRLGDGDMVELVMLALLSRSSGPAPARVLIAGGNI